MSAPSAERVNSGGFFQRLRAWREQHLYSLVSSLGRVLSRPFSTLLTVAVMAIALALPLGMGLALDNIRQFSGSVESSREISVFLRNDIDGPAVVALAQKLRERSDVSAVDIKTPEQGLAEFRQGSELAAALALVDGNPLPSVLIVRPHADDRDLATTLKALPEAELVQHDALWRQRLDAWLAFGMQLAWVVAGLLGLGALLVVGNTVRLDVAAREDEIAVMQQLGATDGFVRRPFLYLGLWYGLAAGALALGLLVIAGTVLQPSLSALMASYGSAFRFDGIEPPLALIVLVGAMFLGWLGAWLATGHHLRRTRPVEI